MKKLTLEVLPSNEACIAGSKVNQNFDINYRYQVKNQKKKESKRIMV